MTTDLVSDMLTRIRNASLAKHSFTKVKYSKQNVAILKVLMGEGYINSYSIEQEKNNMQSLKVLLKYKGWWIYKQFANKLDVLRYEQGIAIISTSSGIMSHIKASKLKKGGEIICYIG